MKFKNLCIALCLFYTAITHSMQRALTASARAAANARPKASIMRLGSAFNETKAVTAAVATIAAKGTTRTKAAILAGAVSAGALYGLKDLYREYVFMDRILDKEIKSPIKINNKKIHKVLKPFNLLPLSNIVFVYSPTFATHATINPKNSHKIGIIYGPFNKKEFPKEFTSSLLHEIGHIESGISTLQATAKVILFNIGTFSTVYFLCAPAKNLLIKSSKMAASFFICIKVLPKAFNFLCNSVDERVADEYAINKLKEARDIESLLAGEQTFKKHHQKRLDQLNLSLFPEVKKLKLNFDDFKYLMHSFLDTHPSSKHRAQAYADAAEAVMISNFPEDEIEGELKKIKLEKCKKTIEEIIEETKDDETKLEKLKDFTEMLLAESLIDETEQAELNKLIEKLTAKTDEVTYN